MLEAINISKKIGRHTILRDCSLRLRPGRLTVVVGPNGAGKSTLLKIISGEDRHFTGNVMLNDTPVRKYGTRELSRRRAILPQQTIINFPFTAEQVVEIGRYPHARTSPELKHQAIEEAIDFTGVQAFRDRMYHTLSGGEKQRVQMARVICQINSGDNESRFLLLDEPTSSLDLAQQHHLLSLARELAARNIGVMAILHDLNLALQYADDILLLKEGRTIGYGAVKETVTAEIIRETFGYPVRLIHHEGQPVIIPDHRVKDPSMNGEEIVHRTNAKKLHQVENLSITYNEQ